MRLKDLLAPDNTIQYKTPIIVSRTFTDQIASATNWIVTPTLVPRAGNLLVIFVGVIQTRTPLSTGWTSVTLTPIAGAKGHAMLWKVSDGTETSITINLAGGSQGAACYYEIENVDTSTTFYHVGSSANQDGADPYFSAASNPFTITRPSIAFSTAVFINSSADWAPNNNFIFNGNRLSATAHRVYKDTVVNEVVTWTRVGGLTSSTKVNMVEIFGKVNTDVVVDFNDSKLRTVQRASAIAASDTALTATVSFATAPAAGNKIILYASYIQTVQDITFPGGFTNFTDEVISGNLRNSIAWGVGDGVTKDFTVTLATAGTVKLAVIAHEIKNSVAAPTVIGKQVTSSTSALTGPVHTANITPPAGSLVICYMNVSNSTNNVVRIGAITTAASLGYGDVILKDRTRMICSAEKYYTSVGNELPYWFWETGRAMNAIAIQIT